MDFYLPLDAPLIRISGNVLVEGSPVDLKRGKWHFVNDLKKFHQTSVGGGMNVVSVHKPKPVADYHERPTVKGKVTALPKETFAALAVLRNPAAHGHPHLPPIRRYRVRFEGYQGQADLIGGELFAETGSRRKALDQNLTKKLLSLPVTDPNGRETTIGGLSHETAETHLDHRYPEWTASEGAYGMIESRIVPRLRITGTITRRRITPLTSRL